MTQFTPNSMAGSGTRGRPNVYTLLLIIAFLALFVACIYVLFRNHTLFGSWNPFDLSPSTAVVNMLFNVVG